MALQQLMAERGWTPQDISGWVGTQTPQHVRSMLGEYGITPGELAPVYNIGAGTQFSPAQAGQYLGYPAMPGATQPRQPTGGVQRPGGQMGARTTQPKPRATTTAPELFNVEQLVGAGTYPTSVSGIPGMQGFLSSLIPQLTQAAGQLPEQAAQFGQTLQDQYANLMRMGMGPQGMQGTLNQLAGRNILSSTVASDALARAGQGIAQQVGAQAYPSMAAGLQQQMAVPGMLGNLAQLGQISGSADPLAPYKLMAQMLM